MNFSQWRRDVEAGVEGSEANFTYPYGIIQDPNFIAGVL